MTRPSGHASGLSLWLIPEGEARARLAALIAELARRHRTPPFEPHVTLLGGLSPQALDVLGRARELARRLRPLRLRSTAPEGSDDHFRCLFVRIEATEALGAAHEEANATFGRAAATFDPHLSLLYGDLARERREKLIAELAGRVEAVFEARRLHVVRTEGPVEAWRELAAYPLGPERA